MSGGTFDYKQYAITDIIEEIQERIDKNGQPDDWGYVYSYSDEAIEKFKIAIDKLKEAQIYAQRIDWFLSGDDGEESFYRRLKEDLEC